MNKNISLETEAEVWSILYIEDYKEKKYLISGESNGCISAWNLITMEKERSYKEHTSFINDLKSLTNSKFVSCSDDLMIKIWDIEQSTSIKTIINDSATYCLAYLPNFNQDYILYGDYSNKITIYNFKKQIKISTIKNVNLQYVCKIIPLIIKNCNFILTSGFTDINLYSLQTLRKVCSYNDNKFGIKDLIHIRDNFFVSLGNDKLIKLWDIFKKISIRTFVMENIETYCILNIRDNLLVGSAKGVQVINIFKEKQSEEKIILGNEEKIFGMISVFNRNNTNSLVTFNGVTKNILIWDILFEVCK